MKKITATQKLWDLSGKRIPQPYEIFRPFDLKRKLCANFSKTVYGKLAKFKCIDGD